MTALEPLPLYVPVLLPIVAGTIGYFVPTRIYKHILIVAQMAVVGIAVHLLAHVRRSGTLVEPLAGWAEPVGITLKLDAISAPLLLLVAVVFLLLFLFNYNKLYMDKLFQFVFVSLQGVIASLFLTADVFNVYVLIELTTVFSTLLIMYKKGKPALYNGMLYLMFSILAMAFFLLGIGFTYQTFGVLDFAGIRERSLAMTDRGALILPYSLMMTAVGMKAGLLPMFGWLPRAHAAPSAPSMVSAMLSGIQIKAGIYLFIRMQLMFGEALATRQLFLVVGILTAVAGFTLAICQRDIKLILAYSTVSQIGLIVIGLTSGSEIGFWGGIYHIINHAVFKALLFLTAGLIAKEYGTRDIAMIRGTVYRMPVVTVAATLAVLGMAGAPFFNGSISKYLIESGLSGDARWQAAIYVVNFGTMLTFTRYATIFFGDPGESRRAARGAVDRWPATVALVFGALILAGGIGAGPLMGILFPVADPGLLASGASAVGKTLVFAATFAAAIATYLLFVRRAVVLDRIRGISVSFNAMAMMMTGFFAFLLFYLLVTV